LTIYPLPPPPPRHTTLPNKSVQRYVCHMFTGEGNDDTALTHSNPLFVPLFVPLLLSLLHSLFFLCSFFVLFLYFLCWLVPQQQVSLEQSPLHHTRRRSESDIMNDLLTTDAQPSSKPSLRTCGWCCRRCTRMSHVLL
jgi:hypothetical protein